MNTLLRAAIAVAALACLAAAEDPPATPPPPPPGSPPAAQDSGPSADRLKKFQAMKLRALQEAGLSPELGGLPPPPPPPQGAPPEPTFQEKEAERAAGYDKQYGPGAYAGLIGFSSRCRSADGCDRLATMDMIGGADNFVALQKDVEQKKLAADSPDYARRHEQIKGGLNQAMEQFRPREGAKPAYVEEFIKVSNPVVKRIFSPEELLQFTQKTAAETKTAPAYAELGRTLDGRGDHVRAREAFTAALRSDPTYSDALTGRAMVSFGQRDFPSAAEDAGAALRLNPQDQAATRTLALSEGRQREGTFASLMKDAGRSRAGAAAAAAGAEFAEAGLEPGTAGAARGSASGAPAEGPGAALGAISRSPERRAQGLVSDARLSMKLGDMRAAAATLRQALAAAPGNPAAAALLSIALNKLHEYPAALQAAEEGLKTHPNDPVLLVAKASALNRLGRYSEALETAGRAAALSPRAAGARFNKAFALAGLGRRAESLEELKAAAEFNPDYLPFLNEALQASTESDLALLFTDAQLGVTPSLADRLMALNPLVWAGAGALAVFAVLALSAALKKRRPAPETRSRPLRFRA